MRFSKNEEISHRARRRERAAASSQSRAALFIGRTFIYTFSIFRSKIETRARARETGRPGETHDLLLVTAERERLPFRYYRERRGRLRRLRRH